MPPDETTTAAAPEAPPQAAEARPEATAGDESEASAGSASARRSLRQVLGSLRGSLGVVAVALVGLFVLALFYTFYFAAGFFLPVTVALLLNFLLSPAVRFLQRLRVPVPLGAGLVMLALLGTLAVGVYYLSGPAAEWIENTPQALREAEYKLRGVRESVERVQEATQQMGTLAGGGDAAGESAPPPARARASEALLSQTTTALAGMAAALFLLYFLLASGDLFLRKLVHVLPLLRRKRIAVQIAHGIERDLSAYLFTYAVINTTLGSVVALALYFIGMPNPVLWGIMVALLNFIPYLGPLVGVTIVGLVAFVSFDSLAHALAAPAAYFCINALEGNLITPLIMGRRLQINPVAIFISLTFWGWIWGIPGALLAVPLLVALKIVCDNVATLRPLGEFIGQ